MPGNPATVGANSATGQAKTSCALHEFLLKSYDSPLVRRRALERIAEEIPNSRIWALAASAIDQYLRLVPQAALIMNRESMELVLAHGQALEEIPQNLTAGDSPHLLKMVRHYDWRLSQLEQIIAKQKGLWEYGRLGGARMEADASQPLSALMIARGVDLPREIPRCREFAFTDPNISMPAVLESYRPLPEMIAAPDALG